MVAMRVLCAQWSSAAAVIVATSCRSAPVAPPPTAAPPPAPIAKAPQAPTLDASAPALTSAPAPTAAPTGKSGIEIACNGVDDDNDGLVDVLMPIAENACTTSQPGACATGWAACRDGARVCDAPPPTPEVVDGIDNDCNGVVDDVAAVHVRPRALVVAPKYAWSDASSDIDTVTSLLDQAGIPYDKQRPNTDWDVKEGSLVGYSLVVIPGYLEGGSVRAPALRAFEAFANGGGVVVVMKPIGNVDNSGAMELAGLITASNVKDATAIKIDGTAPAFTAIDSPEERILPLVDEKHPEPIDTWLFEPGPDTVAVAHAFRGATSLGAVVTRHAVGRGAVYAIGHDLATYAIDRCYVNCFEPAGDILRLVLRDALREGASGHVVLKHSIPGGMDSALILSHDVDAPDAFNAGPWGQPGALQMAALERSLGVRATYNVTTDYVAGYFQPAIVKALCDAGMCPVGGHSVRHLGTFGQHPRGTCTETRATYTAKDPATLCGEIKVALDILAPLSGARPRTWRAPYLLLNPAQFDLLAQNGIEYDSGFGIGDLKYNLPVDLEHIGQKQHLFHHRPILEVPVTCEDGRDSLQNGVHKRVELQPSNRATFEAQWRYALLRNAANEAITTLLVHPSRGHEMPDDNISVKVDAVGDIVRFAKNQKDIAFETIDDMGRFWRARLQTQIDAEYDAETGYKGTITTGLLPVHELALDFGDAIGAFTCDGCGSFEIRGKRVVLPLLKAHARLTFKATTANRAAKP